MYYFNDETKELIYVNEDNEFTVLEPIEGLGGAVAREERAPKSPSKKKKGACSICGRSGHKKTTCPQKEDNESQAGIDEELTPTGRIKKKRKGSIDEETRAKIIAMRKDGHSGTQIALELGVNKTSVYIILNEVGISGHQTKDDDMRCAKCKKKGHTAIECPTGDALDQLDKAEGWDEAKPILSRKDYAEIKSLHFRDGLNAEEIRINFTALGKDGITKVLDSKNYEEFISTYVANA